MDNNTVQEIEDDIYFHLFISLFINSHLYPFAKSILKVQFTKR